VVANPELVIAVPGVGEKTAAKIVRSAREYLGLEVEGPTADDGQVEGEPEQDAQEALLVAEGSSAGSEGAERTEGTEVTGGER
jgi:hypothetical protein